MKDLFLKYNIDIDQEKLDKFSVYFDLLTFYNNQFNLTAITEKKEVYLKHFIDSLLFTEFSTNKKLIDIGSGGGFPALPIKIMNNSLSLTMVEATEKKCNFLKTVAKELNLSNVEVINKRAEDLSKDSFFRENFDYASARAVARMNVLCEYVMPFIKVGGKFIAFKGSDESEILESLNAIKILGGNIEKVISTNLEDAKRNIVIVQKIKSTPNIYPRKNGQIRKKPL